MTIADDHITCPECDGTGVASDPPAAIADDGVPCLVCGGETIVDEFAWSLACLCRDPSELPDSVVYMMNGRLYRKPRGEPGSRL